MTPPVVVLPTMRKTAYVRPPIYDQTFVPQIY
jgi:hypothetical protein